MALDWQNIDRPIRGHIAADHDIDQTDARQICGEEVQDLARDGPFAPVEVFGRSTLLMTPQMMSRKHQPVSFFAH